MSVWTCDGIPKDGKQYPGAFPHNPQDNTGPDCTLCGLPQEAMQPGKTVKAQPTTKTQVIGTSGGGNSLKSWLIPTVVAMLFLLIGGGLAVYRLLKPNDQTIQTRGSDSSSTTTPTPVAPDTGESVSRGEKLFLNASTYKQAGAEAFAQENWEEAIIAYQTAAQENANDPEASIYLNNAQAKQARNPITIAVAVPTSLSSSSADSAAEILRGVAQYQKDYNQSLASDRLLEVAIIDSSDRNTASNVAQGIIDSPDVLGIVGYGIDQGSQAALANYESQGMPVLSPLTTSFQDSILKLIPLDKKEDELLVKYLQAVGKTLTQYAMQQESSPAIAVFYNRDSGYSQQLQLEIIKAVGAVNGNVVQQIDITSPDFNANSAIQEAQNNGANIAILALSKSKVSQAVEIAKANENSGSPLKLMGGDELYNADILVDGGDAIAGIVLAVPWSFSGDKKFATQALQSWKGRVSWRTATAYDATKALVQTVSQNPYRGGVYQAFTNGVTITDSNTDFSVFNEVPLVKAVRGNQGPRGSNYQFEPIK
ncbi:MAG: ABC transporter substrate-binding protein [Crocosphaera sp.]|nr:ABC transporter substrate-binding protein [Crocosphaera sp.]